LTIFDEVLVDRREFLAATAVAAVSSLPKLDAIAQPATRQYIELRRYHLTSSFSPPRTRRSESARGAFFRA